jgi:hypothetical protein
MNLVLRKCREVPVIAFIFANDDEFCANWYLRGKPLSAQRNGAPGMPYSHSRGRQNPCKPLPEGQLSLGG